MPNMSEMFYPSLWNYWTHPRISGYILQMTGTILLHRVWDYWKENMAAMLSSPGQGSCFQDEGGERVCKGRMDG